jgi:hypothetical protein
MKSILGWTCVATVAVMAAMPLAALAQHRGPGWHGDIRVFETHDARRWHSGAWRHGWHGGRNGWWWVAGGGWYFYPQPVYPYPDPYIPPTVVIEQPSVQVVPAQPPVAQPAQQQFWYYCNASRGYYPYVASCPGGWKTVPATPSGAPQ